MSTYEGSSGFYDPLYEYISIDRRWTIEGVDLMDFVNSIEFSRQLYLRQNGMGCFVFPSSTHTRFAHALGACHLGFIAAERCQVYDADTATSGSLGDFLRQHGWSVVFSLSLLLHDIGHFAFSHTLEGNFGLWSYLKGECKVDRISHEDATCSLILGKEAFFRAARRAQINSGRLKNRVPHVHQVIRDKLPEPKRAENAICYLISGHDNYLSGGFSEVEKRQLVVIHEFVSGLLDLDRIDHYRRDVYFSGLRRGTGLNFRRLLDGITVRYEETSSNGNGNLILSGDAFGQAVTLLQVRERLTYDLFQNPAVLANEAMLNRAVCLYARDKGLSADDVFDLLYWSDEELLLTLARSDPAAVREITYRILNRIPYAFVDKIDCGDWHPSVTNTNGLAQIIEREIEEEDGDLLFSLTGPWKWETQVIPGLPNERVTQAVPSQEWFQHNRVKTVQHSQVDRDRDVEQLKALRSDSTRCLWLFRSEQPDEQSRSRIMNSVRDRLLANAFRA